MIVTACNHEFDNGTPARINRRAGVLELAPSFFRKSQDEKEFILLHELGHLELDTTDEMKADKYAANNLYKKIGLKRTFNALNSALHDTAESDVRRVRMFNHLAGIDRRENNNNIMNVNIEDIEYNSTTGDMYFPIQVTNPDGFRYINQYVGESAIIEDEEVTDYVNWCKFYNIPPSPDAIQAFRAMKSRDVGTYDNVSTAKKNAEAEKARLAQMLERGQITAAEYSKLVSQVDDRSGFQKFWDSATKGVGETVGRILGNSGETEYTQESKGVMMPIAIALLVVAVIVIVFAFKNK